MICIVNGITGISINGIEYKAEDRVLEIPDDLYPKIVHHPNIRAATGKEIASLERIKAAEKAKKATPLEQESKGSDKSGDK